MRNFFALSAPYGACQQVSASKPMLCIEEKGVLLGCYPSRTILAHRVLHNAPYSEIPLGLGIPLFWLLTRYVYSRLQRSREEYQGSFHSTNVLCAICLSPEGRDTSFKWSLFFKADSIALPTFQVVGHLPALSAGRHTCITSHRN